MLLTAFIFAFFDEAIYFNGRLLSAMVLIYAVGECWKFCASLFGIKRKKVSWFAVLFIGAGGFHRYALGTLIFPDSRLADWRHDGRVCYGVCL